MKKYILTLFMTMLMASTILGNIVYAQETVWVDVRTKQEWDSGHLEKAILIPYDQISKKIASVVKSKKQPINLYCRSGRRAAIAQKTLEKLGYINVQNLGGINRLEAQGHKVVK